MKDVVAKLKFKSDEVVVINAPKVLVEEFKFLGYSTTLKHKIQSKNTLIFIQNEQEFINFLQTKIKHIETDSVLWFAYPKGSSKIKTDINRDTIRII